MHIALVSDLDTSAMGIVERTTLRLRQWKAKLLAEPSPAVEVEAPDADESQIKGGSRKDENKREIATEMEYAKRNKINREVLRREMAGH